MANSESHPSRAAQRFNLAVSALVFVGMLVFSAWVAVTSLQRGDGAIRTLAGIVMAGAALTLLAAVREAWQAGQPLQYGMKSGMGFGLLVIGTAILFAGLGG